MPHRRKAFILYVIALALLLRIESFVPNFGKCFNELQGSSLYLSTNDKSFSTDKIDNFEWINNNLIPVPISNKYSQSSIFNSIVDYDAKTQSIVYECTLGRQLGIEISQGPNGAVVSSVELGSKADQIGLLTGDSIIGISATAGEMIWSHENAESVKAALNTRFVMSSTAKLRLTRRLADVPADIRSTLKIPYIYDVRLKRPIGLHVLEGPNKQVFVQEVKPDQGAARTKKINVGDQVLAMSASWGDRMWDVNSVESFVVGVKMRSDSQLSFKLKRMILLTDHISQEESKLERATRKNFTSGSEVSRDINSNKQPDPISFSQLLSQAKNGTNVENIYRMLKLGEFYATKLDVFSANKLMTSAIDMERSDIAIKIFEECFGFFYESLNPAKDMIKGFKDVDEMQELFPKGGWVDSPLSRSAANQGAKRLNPNNYVCTTAVKAYGRLNKEEIAMAVLPWFESKSLEKPDIHLMSALLYVCAKHKLVPQAERIFWEEIPKRKLTYTVATMNSLMYMYSRLNRPDDALRVYELIKTLDIKCSAVTFGVLIKALISSGKKQLETTSFEILDSLPSMGIVPTIELYNQFLEHYAITHNFRQAKRVLNLMAQMKPRVKPDAITYGYLITCFSNAKKPKSALGIYYQMKYRNIAANGYIYMGVLKALLHMRDGVSAVQVILEMEENNVTPDKRHISMAMFACVLSGVNNFAESLLSSFLRKGGQPDTVLYTILLRALLQQNKWAESYALFKKMTSGNNNVKPNFQTCNTLLRFQVKDGRFDEAKDTLDLILSTLKSNVGFLPQSMIVIGQESPQSVLFDSCDALSVALGSYSQRLVRLTLEDARKAVSTKYENDEDKLSASDSYDFREFGFSQGEVDLATPDIFSLQTLVEFVTLIAAKDGSLIEPNFYADLLRALISEASPELIAQVLDIGKSSHLKVQRVDMSMLTKIEELARRAIQGKRMGQISVNAPGDDMVLSNSKVPKLNSIGIDGDSDEIIDSISKRYSRKRISS